MKELISKFPDLIEAMLQKILQVTSKNDRPEAILARKKLVETLSHATKEMKALSQQEGEPLSVEEVAKIVYQKRDA